MLSDAYVTSEFDCTAPIGPWEVTTALASLCAGLQEEYTELLTKRGAILFLLLEVASWVCYSWHSKTKGFGPVFT